MSGTTSGHGQWIRRRKRRSWPKRIWRTLFPSRKPAQSATVLVVLVLIALALAVSTWYVEKWPSLLNTLPAP